MAKGPNSLPTTTLRRNMCEVMADLKEINDPCLLAMGELLSKLIAEATDPAPDQPRMASTRARVEVEWLPPRQPEDGDSIIPWETRTNGYKLDDKGKCEKWD